MQQHAETHQIESIEQFAEFVNEHGWTDGLPVFPPTREGVDAIIEYVGRKPDEILGTIFPGDGVATLQNVGDPRTTLRATRSNLIAALVA